MSSQNGPRHAKNVSSGKYGQRSSRSACVSEHSDPGLHCPLTESLDTTETMNGDHRPGLYLAHGQDDVNLRILRMFKGTF